MEPGATANYGASFMVRQEGRNHEKRSRGARGGDKGQFLPVSTVVPGVPDNSELFLHLVRALEPLPRVLGVSGGLEEGAL